MEIFLPDKVKFIIDRMSAAGKRADVVGGALRDACLGREVSDYDLTTDATPEEIKSIFSDVRTIDTGIKHGTVTVHLDGKNYEITTYRRDGEYKDGRHPDSVEFTTSLADDLSRRDFTVNAMCYCPRWGFTDLFGGISDLNSRIIRTVGEPKKRFSEDALRILRALRFASVLDFEIEPQTREAVLSSAHLLRAVSAERIWVEWYKLLGGVGAHRIISRFGEVIRVFMPELENIVLPSEEDFLRADVDTRMLAIFALSHSSPALAFERTAAALKTDKRTRADGTARLKFTESEAPKSVPEMLFAMSIYGPEITESALKLGRLASKYGDEVTELFSEARASGTPYSIGMLAVGGADILGLGLRGEAVGAALGSALRAVIEGRIQNTKEDVIRLVTGELPKA